MPIPILKLPFLALKVVFKYLDNVELLKISICNKKADRAVKMCRANLSIFNVGLGDMDRLTDLDKFQLLLSEAQNSDAKAKFGVNSTSLKVVVSDILLLNFIVRYDIRITIAIESVRSTKQYNGYRKNVNIDGTSIPLIFSNNQLYAFFVGKVQGLQFFVNYFETNYRLIFCNWEFENSTSCLKQLVDYLNSLPKEINSAEGTAKVQSVSVGKDSKLCHADYKYILKTVTYNLECHKETPMNFKFSGQFATQKLVLTSAHWFNLEHLLRCKCDSIQVEGSQFTNEELGIFMEKWSTGELSQFQKIHVELKEKLDLNVILSGVKIITSTNDPRITSILSLRRPTKMIEGKTRVRANVNNDQNLNPGVFILNKI